MRKIITRSAGLAVVLGLLFAACSGSDDAGVATIYDRDTGNDGAAPETTMAPTTTAAPASYGEEPPADAESGEPGTNAVATIAGNAADLGRMIIYTATLEVEVSDVITANAEAAAAVAGLGGIVFGQETITGDHPRSILTIKVPPENFQAALDRLAGVGKLLGQTIYADDVTERVVDLESRIITAAASVERLRTFLLDATDLETVAKLEKELLDRETELELLRGRLRTLEDQVSLATIVITFTEPVPPVPMPSIEIIQTGYSGHDGGAGCPGAEELRIDEGSEYTVCIVLTNTGDTLLTEIEVRDPGIKADADDFVLLQGVANAPLAPGQSLVFYFEGEAKPNRSYTDPTARATAVDEDGSPLLVQVELSRERLRLTIDEDDSLPGFTDGLAAAWRAVQKIIGLVVVVSGAVIPFLWLPVVVAAAYWFWRRRNRSADKPAAPPAEGPNDSTGSEE